MLLIRHKIGTNFRSTHDFSYSIESAFSENYLCFSIKAYLINVYHTGMYTEDVSVKRATQVPHPITKGL